MYNKSISCSIILVVIFFNSFAQTVDMAENISPLLVGEKIPGAMVMDQNGEQIDLVSIIAKKPTVLVVFRGSWCPYCSVQLSGLAKAEEKILAQGYQIVAISPDDFRSISKLEKKEVKYQLYSDPEAGLIKAIGIAFDAGSKRGILPVPSVFVLNKEAEILFEHINPNYKVRIESDYLIAVLEALGN